MGSLDFGRAKDQFIHLINSVQQQFLPQFTMWLDYKLAEYKVVGKVEGDDDAKDYPEWVLKGMRQHFMSIFDTTAASQRSEEAKPIQSSSNLSHFEKRKRKHPLLHNDRPAKRRSSVEESHGLTGAFNVEEPKTNDNTENVFNSLDERLGEGENGVQIVKEEAKPFEVDTESTPTESVHSTMPIHPIMLNAPIFPGAPLNYPHFAPQLNTPPMPKLAAKPVPLNASASSTPGMGSFDQKSVVMDQNKVLEIVKQVIPENTVVESAAHHELLIAKALEALALQGGEKAELTHHWTMARGMLQYLMDRDERRMLLYIPNFELDEHLAAYFRESRKRDGSVLKRQTLRNLRTSLRKFCLALGIDIYSEDFSRTTTAYNLKLNEASSGDIKRPTVFDNIKLAL